MNQLIINIILIIAISSINIYQYKKKYFNGVCFAIFFLIVSPENLAISFSAALPTISLQRIILVIMFIMWLKNIKLNNNIIIPYIKIFNLIIICLGISTLLSDNLLVSFKRYLYYIFEYYILYIIIASFIDNIDKIYIILKYIIFALFFVAILGVTQRYIGFNPRLLFGQSLETYEFMPDHTRQFSKTVTSTFPHRILFGIAMGILLINALFMLDKEKKKKIKLVYWISSFTGAAALYFSQSRGPWLAFCISCIFIYIFFYKPMIKKITLIGILTAVALLIRPGVYQTIAEMGKNTLNPNSVKGSSYRWRFQVFNTAYTKIVEDADVLIFLFGYGAGSHLFHKFEPILLSSGEHYGDLTSWDCEYAIILYSRGVIGLILLLYLYIIFLKDSTVYLLFKRKHKDIVLVSLCSLIIIFFMKTNVSFFAPQVVYLESIYIALGSAIFKKKLNE